MDKEEQISGRNLARLIGHLWTGFYEYSRLAKGLPFPTPAPSPRKNTGEIWHYVVPQLSLSHSQQAGFNIPWPDLPEPDLGPTPSVSPVGIS